MLLEIVRPSCYHQISKEILNFTKHLRNMHIHVCGTVLMVAVLASLTDQQFITFHFQITEVNSSHIRLRVQTGDTFSWKSKWESSRKIFHSFSIILYQYSTLHVPLLKVLKVHVHVCEFCHVT